MIEKRFEMVIVDVQGNFYYLDRVTDEKISSTLALEDKLNELADENEQLKQFIDDLYKQYTDNCGSPTDYSNWIFNR